MRATRVPMLDGDRWRTTWTWPSARCASPERERQRAPPLLWLAIAVKHSEVTSMGSKVTSIGAGSLKLIRVVSMVFMAVGCASASYAQTFTTYGGAATALVGTVAGIPVHLAGTGAIDPSGGALHNSLVCYPRGSQCDVGCPPD